MPTYKNLKSAPGCNCPCKASLCHWENYSGKKATICSVKGCPNTEDLVGGHVINCHGNAYNNWFIVPLCRECNTPSNTDCFELKSGIFPVPVILRDKCKPCK